MKSTKQLSRILLLTVSFMCFIMADKIPSTDDIDDYNDPVLREVFAASRKSRPTIDQAPQQSQLQQNRGRGSNNLGLQATQYPPQVYRTVAPVYQPSYTNNNQPPSLSRPSNGYNNGDFGSLASQGAQSFFQGAQQVGKVFGIDSPQYGGSASAYEFPLGGGFFGK